MMLGTVAYRYTYLGHTADLDEAFAIAEAVARRPLPRPESGGGGGAACSGT